MSPPPSARPPTLRACAVCGLLTEGTVRASELGRRWNLDEARPCCSKCRVSMGLPGVAPAPGREAALVHAPQKPRPPVDAEIRSARTKAGMAAARARGVHVGRPHVVIDISPALALLSEGHGLKTVARMTGISRATLRRRLIEEGLWPVSGQTETPNRSPEP